jgi:hypothetical protein
VKEGIPWLREKYKSSLVKDFRVLAIVYKAI